MEKTNEQVVKTRIGIVVRNGFVKKVKADEDILNGMTDIVAIVATEGQFKIFEEGFELGKKAVIIPAETSDSGC